MKTFIKNLREQKIFLTEKQVKQFEMYYELLVEWNEKMNLTAITEKSEVYMKHFYDSLTMAFDIDIENQLFCDVGSGAGFPGIPLKIAFPHIVLHIVEPNKKRCSFLNEVISKLKLENVKVFSDRAEEHVDKYRSYYDIVTGRAVANLSMLLELCLPLVRVGGRFFSYKGSKGMEELQQARWAMEKLGGRVEQMRELVLPKEYATRINFCIYKDNRTPDRFPRPFAQIKNRPLSNN